MAEEISVLLCERCGGACLKRFQLHNRVWVCRTCYKEYLDTFTKYMRMES